MLSFSQYLLLSENILGGVRAAVLGLTVSQDLPPNPPYGFWTDRSGNYKVVAGFSSGGHSQAAKDMILAAYDYKEETDQLTPNEERELNVTLKKGHGALYNVLTEMNFMHIVKAADTYFYYVNNVTTSQQKFLNNLTQTYRMKIERSYDIF